jgi:hypothetical protein
MSAVLLAKACPFEGGKKAAEDRNPFSYSIWQDYKFLILNWLHGLTQPIRRGA